MTLTDYAGNLIEVGDKVLYVTCSYRCARMRVGIVRAFHNDDRVSIQPIMDMHGDKITRTIYIDQRTGKIVSPYDHIKESSYYTHADTGEKLQDGYWLTHKREPYIPGRLPTPNPDYVPTDKRKLAPTVYQDYLLKIELEGGNIGVVNKSWNIVKVA